MTLAELGFVLQRCNTEREVEVQEIRKYPKDRLPQRWDVNTIGDLMRILNKEDLRITFDYS